MNRKGAASRTLLVLSFETDLRNKHKTRWCQVTIEQDFSLYLRPFDFFMNRDVSTSGQVTTVSATRVCSLGLHNGRKGVRPICQQGAEVSADTVCHHLLCLFSLLFLLQKMSKNIYECCDVGTLHS